MENALNWGNHVPSHWLGLEPEAHMLVRLRRQAVGNAKITCGCRFVCAYLHTQEIVSNLYSCHPFKVVKSLPLVWDTWFDFK